MASALCSASAAPLWWSSEARGNPGLKPSPWQPGQRPAAVPGPRCGPRAAAAARWTSRRRNAVAAATSSPEVGMNSSGAASEARLLAAAAAAAARRRRHSSPLLVPFCSRPPPASLSAQAAALVQGFSLEHEMPHGRLSIRPVQPEDVGPASVLLTRSFATSLQGVPLQDGRQYCLDSLRQPPHGVLLVARLHPAGERGGRARSKPAEPAGLQVALSSQSRVCSCCLHNSPSFRRRLLLSHHPCPRPPGRPIAAATRAAVPPGCHHGPVLQPQHTGAVPHAAAARR